MAEPEAESYELEASLIEKGNSETITLSVPPVGESAQPTDEQDVWTPDGSITPPENLSALKKLTENSWARASAIDAIALNSVGLGWELVPNKDNAQMPKEEIAAAATTLDVLAERDLRLKNPNFSELLFAVKSDEEECGNGYIEVSRSKRDGMIDGLFHVPGDRVRRLTDREKGWIVARTDLDVADPDTNLFYNFGDKVQYGSDGKPTNKLVSGKRWARNELIPFQLYNSESRDYGLPRDIALSLEYAAAKLASEWNVGFFDSSGTPPTILFVQGVQRQDGSRITFTVPPEVTQRIEQTLSAGGPRQRRVAVIPVPGGTKTESVQLGQLSDRDMGFSDFKKQHALNVCGAFRISPIFIGITDTGRYTAEVERALTLEQTFDPEQRRYEERLQRTLLRDLGYGEMNLKFKRLAVEGDAARRDSADRLAEAGAITVQELREAHGWPPLIEEHEEMNEEIVSMGQPEGADDRTVEGTSQRGLRPGIGGRVQKHANGHGPDWVEEEVTELIESLAGDEDD